jgi:hypothetical protein
MELIIVMGIMGMLAALAVGFLTNIGQSTIMDQGRAALTETATACQAASNGGRRATLSVVRRKDDFQNEYLVVGAEVARPVLTCQFETLNFASQGRRPEPVGAARVVPAGRTGNALELKGGSLAFPAAPDFAMTEGIEADLWVAVDPAAAARRMVLLTSEPTAYELALERSGDSGAYDVVLTLLVRPAKDTARTAAALPKVYRSKGAPVRGDGRWHQVQVGWNGLTASLRVNGLETSDTKPARPRAGAVGPEEMAQIDRIAIPPEGVLQVHVSSSRAGFHGRVDSLQLRGVFRDDEAERELPPAFRIESPPLPLRVVFHNGRLDPDVHADDVLLEFSDETHPDDPHMHLLIGRFGSIEPYKPRAAPGPQGAPAGGPAR